MAEYIKCDLCGKDNTVLLYKVGEWRIVQCQNCDLVYTNPRLNQADRIKMYTEEYFKGTSLGESGGFDFVTNESILQLDSKLRLKEIMKLAHPPGKLLEIGSARGTFLDIACRYGWSVTGVEISAAAAQYSREKWGVEVFNSDFLDINFPPGSFDVITMYHLLEHVASPKLALQRVSHLLKPNGLVVITVPDTCSGNALRMKETWIHLAPMAHLYHFSKETLIRFLSECNLSPVRVVRTGGTGLLNNNTGSSVSGLLRNYVKYLNWIRPYVYWLMVNLFNKYDFITIYARKR